MSTLSDWEKAEHDGHTSHLIVVADSNNTVTLTTEALALLLEQAGWTRKYQSAPAPRVRTPRRAVIL